MKSVTSKQSILFFLSGMFAAYIVLNAFFVLSWVAYLPLFVLLNQITKKQYLMAGLAVGFGVSFITFFWMMGATKEFSGNSFLIGALVTFLSVLIFCIYWGLLIWILGFLQNKPQKWSLAKPILAASCFTLGEALLTFLFDQMPYYLYNSGYGLLNQVFTVQWAAFFGLPFLNFMLVLFNCLLAQIIIHKKWKLWWQPLLILIFSLVGGWYFLNYARRLKSTKPITVAIAVENIPPQLRWDEQGGNVLAQRLLSLNQQAAALKPDIVLWSESTLPWAYQPNDDLLLELLKEPYPTKSIHFLGYMSNHSTAKLYNSIYALYAANGKVLGRYDKRYLLDFVETKSLGLNIPFLDLGDYLIAQGRDAQPISTPFGRAGLMICNEVIKPQAALSAAKKGAQFLLNASNDGWFKESAFVNIAKVHFLYARLSAVITRKDVVVNCNHGVSGLIKASGEITSAKSADDLYVEKLNVYPNHINWTIYYCPHLVLAFALFFLVFYYTYNQFFIKKVKTT